MPCQNPINWNFLLENPQDPSTTRIVCDLPPRDGSKGSDWFSLILKVDGEEVENSFTVRYRDRYTPLIKEVNCQRSIAEFPSARRKPPLGPSPS